MAKRFKGGEDAKDGCEGRAKASCSATLSEGLVEVRFGDESGELTVPSGERLCLAASGDAYESGL